jgi:hypothetical protein
MKNSNAKSQDKQILREGLIDRFIDSFFDSYKKGIHKQFTNKTRERYPELAKSLEDVVKELDKSMEIIRNKKPVS